MTILVCRDVAKSQFDELDNSQCRGEGVNGSKQNFNYDLLGCRMMALSTFFTGLSMKAKNKVDKWLKAIMMIHGVFCLEKDEIIYPII